MNGTFYLVATPIGNLEDFSPRAARVLREADLVLCEDTRHSAKLMQAANAKAQLLSCHEYNESERLTRVVAELSQGRKVALVSDAGTPAISDPGFYLVRGLRQQGFKVEPVPGPCAAITALSAGGLPTDRFTFMGFPPEAMGKRKAFFAEAAALSHTLVFYLSPHKAARHLADAAEVLGPRPAVLARELTKLFESFYDATLQELAERLALEAPKGELVLLVAGKPRETPQEGDTEAHLARLKAQGLSGKALMQALMSELKLPRKTAYALAHQDSDDEPTEEPNPENEE